MSHVDQSVEVKGFALKSKDGEFEPWTYNPRKLGSEEVEVSITHCGICASDIHTAFGGWGQTYYPIIVGHEIVGSVSKVGDKVTKFKVGDRVGVGAQCGACSDFGKSCRGCSRHQPNHCDEMIGTYDGTYPDGEHAQGGYANMKRLSQQFVFHIPEAISSAEAAPLLCAGATVYSPLKRYGAAKGKRVAIIGVGGLGHLAVQFSAKMGAETYAFGTSMAKKDLAIKLGAKDYISIKDKEAMKKAVGTFDLIICTADVTDQDWNSYVKLGDLDAQFCTVAIPDDPLKLSAGTLCHFRVNVTGSSIGSPDEIREMLEFSAKNDVRPMIELLPMSQVNKGIEKVKKNDVKFRVVLEQGK